MREMKGLGGYGIKGLRKNLLTRGPQRPRRTFRYYAESQNVVWVALVMVLMLGLEFTVRAD